MAARQVASQTEKEPREIKLAHSPDSDDAFMFYALATHKLQTPGYKYTHILSDIQSLNEAALTETYDVTAVSFAAYPSLRDKYILLDCGASFGEGYGPIVVSTKSMRPQDLKGKRVGVPGLKTSAYLSLRLYQPDFEAVVMPFDKIIEAVKNDMVEAGLLIHEGQLFFPQLGLHKVVDLGIWWQELTNLPLPLGGNAVRRALGPDMGRLISKTIRDSVSYGLEHRQEALNYAMQFAREMDTELADKFVGVYRNRCTLCHGPPGERDVQEQIKQYITSQPEPKLSDMRELHRLTLQVSPGGKLWFFDGKDSKYHDVSNATIGEGFHLIKYANGKRREFFQTCVSGNKAG